MELTSRDNPWVKEWRKLAADARYRRRSGRFVLEGARLCADAALSGVELPAAFITDEARKQYDDCVAPLLAHAKQVFTIPTTLAAYIGETTSTQGVFAIGVKQERPLPITTSGRYLVLEDVQDPANLGTVIRTAEALGIDGLLLTSGCCDVYSPKVLRGSMGGVFRLPIGRVDHLPAAIPQWQELGMAVYACVVDGDAELLNEVRFQDGTLCLIGNEGNGLKPETVTACAHHLTIPMAGRAESLNASMAAGIVLWELSRKGR